MIHIPIYHTIDITRPKWDKTTTPSQLERNERDVFLQWRRDLALCVIINILSTFHCLNPLKYYNKINL